MEGDTNLSGSYYFNLLLITQAVYWGALALYWMVRKVGIAFPPMGFFNRPPTIPNPSPTRVMAVGSAVAVTGNYPRGRYNLPPGWSYDAVTQRYEHVSGLSVDRLVANVDPRGVHIALLDVQSRQYSTPPGSYALQAQQHQALTQQFNSNRLTASQAVFPGGLTYFSVPNTSTSALSIQSFLTTGVNPMWFSGAAFIAGGTTPSNQTLHGVLFDDMLPTTDTSELLRASEIVEQFESFMKSMGANSPLKLPGEVFTRWLAYEAGVREDGDTMSPTTREILIGLETHPAVVEQIKAGK